MLAPLLLACLTCMEAAYTPALAADANPAAALRARFAALGNKLANSPFDRPLHLDSTESSTSVRGDVFALVDHPFAEVQAAFNGPARWCEVLILHINTKFCATATTAAGTVLTLNIGKKTDEPLQETTRVDFDFNVAAATPEYLAVQLRADRGPLSTSDYRILLEAVPAEGGKTILHLTYSYGFGATGRLAMQVYLATAGRGKVGFTATGRQADGKPDYIGGVRGVVERNTMRYFRAIDAYLSAPLRFETRVQNWYDATENYPRQLHEVERSAYLEMKRREYQRQQAALK
ncbi:MAG TPA: hypothetical protein VGO84_04525 [Burkholderiales bacterium]|nr:hypothetical protein [Burkholderiales bacterium]